MTGTATAPITASILARMTARGVDRCGGDEIGRVLARDGEPGQARRRAGPPPSPAPARAASGCRPPSRNCATAAGPAARGRGAASASARRARGRAAGASIPCGGARARRGAGEDAAPGRLPDLGLGEPGGGGGVAGEAPGGEDRDDAEKKRARHQHHGQRVDVAHGPLGGQPEEAVDRRRDGEDGLRMEGGDARQAAIGMIETTWTPTAKAAPTMAARTCARSACAWPDQREQARWSAPGPSAAAAAPRPATTA